MNICMLYIYIYIHIYICTYVNIDKKHIIYRIHFVLFSGYFFGAVEKVFKEIKRNTSSLKCVNSMEKNNNIFCKIF